MRVRTFLRPIREGRAKTLSEVARATGIPKGELSMLERGHSIPTLAQMSVMKGYYGNAIHWYPIGVLNVLLPDLRHCDGCGEELPPDASRRRLYHDAECRAAARRNRRGH